MEEVKTFYIFSRTFIDWYFNEGDEDERKAIFQDIAETIAFDVINSGKCVIDADHFFKNCNKAIIPIRLLVDKHGCSLEVDDISDISWFTIELLKD